MSSIPYRPLPGIPLALPALAPEAGAVTATRLRCENRFISHIAHHSLWPAAGHHHHQLGKETLEFES